MSELSPKARALLRSGRALHRPTDADRERIQNALRNRLGAAILLASSGAEGKALVPRPRWPLISSAVVSAGLAGVALFIAFRPPSLPPSASPAPPAPVLARPSAVPPLPPPPDRSAPAVIAANTSSVPPQRPARDRLAQEVALLSRATSDLHAGRAAEALGVLDEYQRKFPNGLLAQERRAARAQALCALGRRSEAESELERLAPKSLAAARARQACGSDSFTSH